MTNPALWWTQRNKIKKHESEAFTTDTVLNVCCSEVCNNTNVNVEVDFMFSPETGKLLVIVTEIQ